MFLLTILRHVVSIVKTAKFVERYIQDILIKEVVDVSMEKTSV